MATIQELNGALAPGQTGCLLAGSYGDIGTLHVLDHSGTPTAQITITSAPGTTAKLIGLLEIRGSYITLSGLNIDGSNNFYDSERSGTTCPYPVSNGMEIDGTGDIFENNDFYQSVPSLRGNGIGIGWNHPANNTIIRNNRIHDLGQCQAFDQMIYLAHGDNVQIYDNWLWNDHHGWGVQVYPAATNAHIFNNVIDHAGSGFVIGGSTTVSGNTITHNIITNSTGLPNAGLTGVGVSTCCGIGTGNSFTNNDVYNNPGGISDASDITLTGNTTANPHLNHPGLHDYRVTSGRASSNMWDGGLGTLAVAQAASHPVARIALTGTKRRTAAHHRRNAIRRDRRKAIRHARRTRKHRQLRRHHRAAHRRHHATKS